jgi:putative thiamine transport system permease protein
MAAERTSKRTRLLKAAPALTLLLFLGPVGAGLLGAVLPAFGYLPALGGDSLSLEPWRQMADYPGLWGAVGMSLWSGLAAAAISVALTIGFCAACQGTRLFAAMGRVFAPLLAVPHAAFAIGLAFLLAPSGWLLRTLSPWATGSTLPPDIALSPDPYGLNLILALVIKETPFLFLMTMGALAQVPADRTLAIARTLGYSRASAWFKTVLPLIYRQIRLPIFAVVAFSVSVVDVAILLTGSTTPTLSLLIIRWANDPDLGFQFLAAAGSCLQLGVALAAIGLWILGERVIARVGLRWTAGGGRSGGRFFARSATAAVFGLASVGIVSLVGMAIWSFAARWRWPDALPSRWSLDNWTRHAGGAWEPALTTLIVGLAAAAIALVLVLACLEAEDRSGRRPGVRALWLLYTPLIVPQVAFLFGAQVLLLSVGLTGTWGALIWAHLLFVLPYLFLSLAEPFRKLDPRYQRTALCLGVSPARVFWRIKLPMLTRAVLIALAVGFAVSVGEYLPTIFAGGGRLTTLTTEAVAQAGGGDRRLIGVYAVLQATLPLAGFILASQLPGWIFRNRRGMREGL